MHQTARSALKLTCAACAFAAFTLPALAQSSPAPAILPTSAQPGQGRGAPMPTPGPAMFGSSASMFPPMLEGIISHEEYRKYVEFQQHVGDDPALKQLDARISDHLQELRRLRAEASAIREKLTAANPEIRAIRDKISAVLLHSGPGAGPTFMPAPVKSHD